MPRRGNNPFMLSSENINKRKRVSRNQPQQKLEFDPPVELLEIVFSRLSSRDKARVSAVCKKWRDIVASVWEFSRPPVLMSLRPKDGGVPSFEYFNLSSRCKCSTEFPDRPSGQVCHANYGWMLFFDPFVSEVMTFFHAETRECLELPPPRIMLYGAAFSAPPTSPSCVVFTMHNLTSNSAKIFTWRPGHTVWTSVHYQSDRSFGSCLWHCVVIRNGLFHCLSTTGAIGVYDPEQSTWRVADFQPLKFMAFITAADKKQRVHMAEYKGDIFLLRTCRVIQPVVY